MSEDLDKQQAQQQRNWLLIIISILCLALLFFCHWALSSPDSWLTSLRKLALDLIPGFVGALSAYVLFYFLFTSKGISLGGGGDSLDFVVNELKNIVGGVRDLDPTASIEIDTLYTLYGLKETRSSEIFQDFCIDRSGRNRNPIQFLWADVYHGNTISGEIIDNRDGDSWLRVNFNITSNKYPRILNLGCNFAIKPQNDLALDNNSIKRSYLIFDARVPSDIFEKLKSENGDPISEVGLAFRVVNGFMQHWEYGSNKVREYRHFPVKEGDGWKSFTLNLSDQTIWALFDSDGLSDRGPKYATFDEIASLIIKVGKPGTSVEFDVGMGVVDIRNVRLSDNSPMSI